MDAFVVKPYDEATIRGVLMAAGEKRQGIKDGFVGGSAPAVPGPAPMTPSGFNLGIFSIVGKEDGEKTAKAAADFLASIESEVEGVRQAAEAGRWPEAAQTAHRLCSLSGLVNAKALRTAAKAVQTEVEQAGDRRRETLIGELSRQAEKVKAEVEDAVAALRK
jgi:HPt (histidine-containing phosphotransfer) domain-containing protein